MTIRRLLLTAALCGPVTVAAAQAPPTYNRDVRPILASHCFECHGPDEGTREADLRLDRREDALADRGGYAAITPNDPAASELIARITSTDPDVMMPPPDAKKPLSPAQIALLRQWIDAGAEYELHWSFAPPVQAPLPDVQQTDWPRNPIDHFVLARLEAEGLSPSPEADPYTLVRRVYLDLIGLPPTPEQADEFVNAYNDPTQPQAYLRLVDELLRSPHYGERWARQWLDLARYADTNGYEKDRDRSIWPYRDWVINALNADMPFDQFSIEQLAGDMLPNATLDQRIATGFHRNTMLNEEGGIDPLEYRYYAMIDRVATTGTVWMGLTIGCAQCHTHKFDPITHTDYYALMALLDNADEPELIVPDPTIAGRRAEIEGQIEELEAALPTRFPPLPGDGPEADRRRQHFDQRFAVWLEQMRDAVADWTVIRPTELTSNLPRLELQEDGSIFSSGDITKRDVFDLAFDLTTVGRLSESSGHDSESRPTDRRSTLNPQPSTLNPQLTALRLEVLPDDRLPAGGPGRAYYEGRKGDFFLSELSATSTGQPVAFTDPSVSFGKISIGAGSAEAANVIDGNGDTGWSTAGREGERNTLVLNFKPPFTLPARLDVRLLFERHFAASLGRFRFSVTSKDGPVQAVDLPASLEDVLLREPETWTDDDRAALRRQFVRLAPELEEARQPIDKLRQSLPELPTTLVMQERPADNPRITHRHHRGEYLSTREAVEPAVPQIFPQLPEDATADRLSFARWLVSDRNPLVGRVAVNRAWQACFGRGLVNTSEDFGTQGELPSHPRLLDWLAVEFIKDGWSQKRLHRLIVTSATYRQSSNVSPEQLSRDPQNILLARGPRFRVNAETVRDIGLAASGLLSNKVGGPSVRPPQPASVTALAYGNPAWNASQGEDRYRRSLYTFSKRTAPFAAYTVFDAPTGESCLARRERSNTALQALTMLNDPMFLEMAEALAAETVSRETLPAARAARIFRRCLTRPPTEEEITALTAFAAEQQTRLEAGELNPESLCMHHPPTTELAAWTMAARAVLNLDETITKP